MKKIILVFLMIFLCGCGSERHHIALNDKFGFDSIWDARNQTLKISGFDEPFVLFFFAKDCLACVEQIKILNELKNEKNLKIIGVLNGVGRFDEDLQILEQKGVEFISTSDPRSVKYLANVVGGIQGTPVSVVFDKQGKIVKKFIGLYPKFAFESEFLINS